MSHRCFFFIAFLGVAAACRAAGPADVQRMHLPIQQTGEFVDQARLIARCVDPDRDPPGPQHGYDFYNGTIKVHQIRDGKEKVLTIQKALELGVLRIQGMDDAFDLSVVVVEPKPEIMYWIEVGEPTMASVDQGGIQQARKRYNALRESGTLADMDRELDRWRRNFGVGSPRAWQLDEDAFERFYQRLMNPRGKPLPRPNDFLTASDAINAPFPVLDPSKPPIHQVVVNGDRFSISTPGLPGSKPLDDWKRSAFGWAAGKGFPLIVDVRNLSGQRFDLLLKAFDGFDRSLFFTTDPANAARRALAQNGPVRAEFMIDRTLVDKVKRHGVLMKQTLDGMAVGGGKGTMVFEIGHDGGDGVFLRELQRRAEAGHYKGKILVIGVCNLNMNQILEVQAAVLAKEGLGVIGTTEGKLHLPALTLVGLKLRSNPGLLASWRPCNAIRKAYEDAKEDLEIISKIRSDAEVRERLRRTFGPESVPLFDREDGSVDRALIRETLRGLRIDRGRYFDFADARPAGTGRSVA